MKTKALLLTAALGVAGAATSMAQVYSVNAVGYVNTTVYPGFNLIANPLLQGDTTLGTLVPTAADSTSFYGYDPVNGFVIRQYIDGAGWDPDGAPDISAGKGFFLQNVSGSPFTLTFVGEVATGTQTVPLASGFNLIASRVPQTGLITTDLGYPAQENDTAYIYDNGPGGENGYIINQFTGGIWDPAEPLLGVGKAMWINSDGAHPSWVRSFTL